MSDIVLKFANEKQYEIFLAKVKEDVLKEMENKRNYSSNWTTVRDQIEGKMRGEYNDGCGNWYNNQQGLYSTFRLAFQVSRIGELSSVDGKQIQNFHDELFALIDKYREGAK
ncbi:MULTISPECIES: hypothetical protein [unclassified Lysinibacillus]|uniref:hypothetical protein n=1 Tax=unclassified Lysinibacillus TaxID=2636778 RepID=UPI0038159BEE